MDYQRGIRIEVRAAEAHYSHVDPLLHRTFLFIAGKKKSMHACLAVFLLAVKTVVKPELLHLS